MRENLEYNVLCWDTNRHRLIKYNIFRDPDLVKYLDKYFHDKLTFKELCEEFNKQFMWRYWSRCEYELVVTGFPSDGKEEKIDIYTQVKDNIESITWSAIIQYKKAHPRLHKEVRI